MIVGVIVRTAIAVVVVIRIAIAVSVVFVLIEVVEATGRRRIARRID